MTSLIQTYPQLLGIGIDESTALIVQGQTAEVVGDGNVSFYDAQSPEWMSVHAAKDESSETDSAAPTENERAKKDFISVSAGGRFDLKERRALPVNP
jgi:cyanophycinase-like exopeptidase